ncbi:Stp1/IreP family PP2C-type Ser/Thr phosphatase [Kurthia sibirica]|uniref:protein-serine/threonine phosphatase n=1 Tax=Kurthia sibirica TaxID=202750 RepID=A0A2U3AQM7_9BACL|nr:Stp1/IreP family PP2C-type Ser/Thr phosphatase [Kurthia sibirica]PWI26852.1 Stp1/IreP family PP2C-type Ser/Thr phosphatase [Kurthia sibirica]GEK32610.1 protein phosphatase [Kurthia sibirica]
MRYTVESDIGKKRSVNEDRATVISRSNNTVHLAIVADGMGGHNAGDVASTLAVEGLRSRFIAASDSDFLTMSDCTAWLLDTVTQLNKLIYDYSLKNENCQGMGTTLIAAIIAENQASICHVGDSRAYIVDEQGIQLITRDHSYVNILVDSGEISEDEAKIHPKKNYIIKSLGTEATIEPDFYQIQIEEASYFLICSDGLSNKVDQQQIHMIVTSLQSIEEKGQALVQLANENGGEDNITVIIAQPLKDGGDEIA